MKLKLLLPLLLVTAVLIQGCVSKKKYTELQSNFNKSVDTNQKLKQSWQVTQQELAVSKNQVQNLQDQLALANTNAAALQAALNKCLTGNNQGNVNIAKLADQIDASNKYIKQLIDLKNKSDSLNLVLTNNLTRSLSQREMKAVDINDYSTYDVLIEGNTDNVPISKPNIRNNWDLSGLRASSVVQALQTSYNV